MDVLQPGDILIQTAGQPWTGLAWVFTGYANPHAAMVDHVDSQAVIWVVEDTYDGVQLNPWDKPGWKARRPLCDNAVSLAALAGYKARVGKESYGITHLLMVAALDRSGLLDKLTQDPTEATDCKTCSESISYHQRVAGYAPCPQLADRAVLPYDLLTTTRYVDLNL